MNARTVHFPEHLSNKELIAALPLLVQRESQAIAELVAHLAEVDARRLYRDPAAPPPSWRCSLTACCTCPRSACWRHTSPRRTTPPCSRPPSTSASAGSSCSWRSASPSPMCLSRSVSYRCKGHGPPPEF